MALSKKHVDEVCKLGQGEDTCRFLSRCASGWECLKLTPTRKWIDQRVAAGNHSAKGDNCPGEDTKGFDPRPTS